MKPSREKLPRAGTSQEKEGRGKDKKEIWLWVCPGEGVVESKPNVDRSGWGVCAACTKVYGVLHPDKKQEGKTRLRIRADGSGTK